MCELLLSDDDFHQLRNLSGRSRSSLQFASAFNSGRPKRAYNFVEPALITKSGFEERLLAFNGD